MRNSIASGVTVKPVNVSASICELAELAGPRLIEDGMFPVGLDVVDPEGGGREDSRKCAKVLEVNAFSPAARVSASAFGAWTMPRW